MNHNIYVEGNWTQGKRVREQKSLDLLQPGEYLLEVSTGRWFCRAPNGDSGLLLGWLHQIEEHGDGTISCGSLLTFRGWRGVLKKGRWLEA